MKIEVTEKPNEKPIGFGYPQLVRSSESGQILLVWKERDSLLVGVNINGKGARLGEYSENWSKGCFSPYYGEITIKSAV